MPTTETLIWDCPECCGDSSSEDAVCPSTDTLTASGGENSTNTLYSYEGSTQTTTWTFMWNYFGVGAGFYHELFVVCQGGVVTATGMAIGNEVLALCGEYIVYPTITVSSSNPLLVLVDYPTCLDVHIEGTITISE